ncbi:MAG: ABC transporter permease [Phycisphaerae bacterium]|nr:ABC transporter permease [Gemmatimonadaceae bacterium]
MPRLLTRLLQGVAVMFIAATIAFLLIHSLPGDAFSDIAANPNVSPEAVARYRARFHSNDEPVALYWNWLQSVARGDLLHSTWGERPVSRVIADHLPATLQLMSLAFIASMAGGILLGAWQGAHAGAPAERIASKLSVGVISIPDFWLAIILLLIFALKLRWFPVGGMNDAPTGSSFTTVALNRLHHFVLPWLSLTLVDVAVISRFQRAAMREVVQQQFLITARAKGVGESDIRWRHALRVAVLPTITIAGMYFPALFVGAVLVETVFAWPGIGRVLTSAIEQRDYFLVSGVVLVGSAMTALGSLLADVMREWADPRVRT